ncbi:MAG: universal stress protein [Gammaproteobacteria bacterium]|nr:MAG: universal stress protein [Gammaproteobacteria bacterium]UCH39997.1 MAG: universal stress protein [Gammaproteobacteria bacterium]
MSRQNPLKQIDYGKILYVTDLSESGRQAFPHAAAIARRNNAQLTVFHVVENRDLQSLEGYMSNELWEELTSRNLEDARNIMLSRRPEDFAIRNIEQFCEECLADQPEHPVLSYEIKVGTGERLEKILEEAHDGGYDLLVISKHGNRASVKDAVIGDTTRRVIRRSRIPVLVIPLDE